jgi:glutamate N-acetyltransferase/amino-acid N-acetyltransferase
MLAVLTTDADVDAATLDEALRSATRRTLDRIDSDGCMSTNDTVLALASGATGIRPDAGEFKAAVEAVCADLARQLIADAEGATKEVTITVRGAANEDEAVGVGRAVARSNLLKCALFGNDPNWGRVLSAIGTTNAAFEPDQVDVSINGVDICTAGAAGADRSLVDLTGRETSIDVDLHAGPAEASILTNDLSHGYVHENSAYSS